MSNDWKSEVNAALAQLAVSEDAKQWDLPSVFREYRAVEGYPGWYMRKMALRQEIQAMALYDARENLTGSAVMEAGVTLGSLLLFRLDLPQNEEIARAKLAQWMAGTAPLFRPATVDEVLDTFNMESLENAVLKPMGFGVTGREEASGNAESPTTPA